MPSNLAPASEMPLYEAFITVQRWHTAMSKHIYTSLVITQHQSDRIQRELTRMAMWMEEVKPQLTIIIEQYEPLPLEGVNP